MNSAHPKFLERIASNIVELRAVVGEEEAKEYAERFTDILSDDEWAVLIRAIERLKDGGEPSEGS